MNLFFFNSPQPCSTSDLCRKFSILQFFFPQKQLQGSHCQKEKKKKRKKIDRKRPSPQWKKRTQRKGEEEFCLYSPVKTSLPALTCFAYSLILLAQHIHIYFFLNKASVKHLVTRRFESSDCQTALFLLSYSIRRPCDHSGMMKRNRRIEDKPWSCLLILQPFLTLFLKYSHKEKEMDPFRKG